MKTAIRKPFSAIAVLILSLTLTASAQAQTARTTTALEIKYAGVQGNHLLFDVMYNNENAEPFTLDITDAEEFTFYSEKFRDRQFTRRFAVNRTGLTNTIVFEVLSANGNRRQVFTVNGNIRLIEETITAKR